MLLRLLFWLFDLIILGFVLEVVIILTPECIRTSYNIPSMHKNFKIVSNCVLC